MAEVRFKQGWETNVDLSPLLERLGTAIRDDAKRFAPVSTGRLRASLRYVLTADQNPFGIRLQVGSDLDYSVFQEIGTSRMRQQTYLRPALMRRRGGL